MNNTSPGTISHFQGEGKSNVFRILTSTTGRRMPRNSLANECYSRCMRDLVLTMTSACLHAMGRATRQLNGYKTARNDMPLELMIQR